MRLEDIKVGEKYAICASGRFNGRAVKLQVERVDPSAPLRAQVKLTSRGPRSVYSASPDHVICTWEEFQTLCDQARISYMQWRERIEDLGDPTLLGASNESADSLGIVRLAMTPEMATELLLAWDHYKNNSSATGSDGIDDLLEVGEHAAE